MFIEANAGRTSGPSLEMVAANATVGSNIAPLNVSVDQACLLTSGGDFTAYALCGGDGLGHVAGFPVEGTDLIVCYVPTDTATQLVPVCASIVTAEAAGAVAMLFPFCTTDHPGRGSPDQPTGCGALLGAGPESVVVATLYYPHGADGASNPELCLIVAPSLGAPPRYYCAAHTPAGAPGCLEIEAHEREASPSLPILRTLARQTLCSGPSASSAMSCAAPGTVGCFGLEFYQQGNDLCGRLLVSETDPAQPPSDNPVQLFCITP